MTGSVLSLNDVTVTFRSSFGPWRREMTALNGVTFEISEGETLGLVGESGSGKSTTGSIALGLRAQDKGQVMFLGRPFDRRPASRAGLIQAVLQNPSWSLNPRMRVGDSVAEPMDVVAAELSRQTRRDRVRSILGQVGLQPDFADRYPHELSGGQRQRVAVARALITGPRLIVFDEAISALDASVQAQILNLIDDLQTRHRFAALFISHDLAAVRYIAHRIAVMRAGSIVELADTDVFYSTPQHEYSRQLLEAL
ncbi:ATP-binding cassette domain-containing protein [Rhodococcus qingshengii]|uniref:ATP-binding cassette domain-containing protein n=1 Tax=Rhodococcus qingshengii TaxID=334542 RepID=UPI0036DBAD07